MQNFTGFHKKFTSGGACALGIFFIAMFASAEPLNVPDPLVAASSVAAQSADKTAIEQSADKTATEKLAVENSSVVTQAPVNGNAAVNPLKPTVPPQTTSSAAQLASLLGGLILILILIYGLSWFAKRFSQGGFLQNPIIKIVSAMPLGTRERLMLVNVGGKQLLLGVTATQINTLHVFDEPVVPAEKAQSTASDFSQKLMSILQQQNSASPNDVAQKNSNS